MKALSSLPALALAFGLCLPATAQPCQDFYAYVNGDWLSKTELPPERTRIGSFDGLRVTNQAKLDAALRALDPRTAPTPGLRHAANLWRSGWDEAAIERQGLQALRPWLDEIAALRERRQLPHLIAWLASLQIAAPVSVGVRADPMDTRRTTLFIGQGGLSLPDRDDYTRPDATAQRLREAARVYQRELLSELGGAPSDARLDALFGFEQALAQASRSRVELREPRANYHPQVAASLNARAPGLDWAALIAELKLPARAPARFVVGQPEFAQAVARAAAEAPLEVWRDYLSLRLLESYAPALPRRLQDAHFAYVERAQKGAQQPAPRAERLVLLIGGNYGTAPLAQTLGEVFVHAAFPAEAARRSTLLVEDIKEALRVRIHGSSWMTPQTQARALAKLDAMALKIGAPSRWPDYAGLQTRADDLAGNLLRGAQWFQRQRFEDLGRPVDRTRWTTSPHIVNAFAGGLNEITFPAGILQPPFFDPQGDDADNFGGIGMVIGHEITHHFDDRGRQFDALGNLQDWWTPADAKAYRERADAVAALYSSFEALPGEFVNGKLTLGENLSDLGGIQIAHSGLQRALARQAAAPRADGLTPDQAFFRSFALIWRSKQRPEALVQQLRTDTHSPPRFRVNAPLTHSAEFARAHGCRAGDPMVAEPRLSIW